MISVDKFIISSKLINCQKKKFRNISHLLETLSFTKRNTHGHRVDRTDDEATSIDEDTYLEDSFLIKDYTSSEGFIFAFNFQCVNA